MHIYSKMKQTINKAYSLYKFFFHTLQQIKETNTEEEFVVKWWKVLIYLHLMSKLPNCDSHCDHIRNSYTKGANKLDVKKPQNNHLRKKKKTTPLPVSQLCYCQMQTLLASVLWEKLPIYALNLSPVRNFSFSALII